MKNLAYDDASMNTRTSNKIVKIAAAIPRPVSTTLTPARGVAARGAGACRGALAGATLAGAARCAAGAAVGAGVGLGGAEAGVAVAAAEGAGGAGVAAATADGAGILMVGAAVGLGGRFIRTVSFFGCTLAASAGFGGTGPPGGFGVVSAINCSVETRIHSGGCQMRIQRKGPAHDRAGPGQSEVYD